MGSCLDTDIDAANQIKIDFNCLVLCTKVPWDL